MKDTTSPPGEIVVVGAGMAAHRFVERLLRDPGTAARVTVIGDEGYGPYDRSEVAGLLSGDDPAELQLDRSVFRDDRVRLVRDDRVLRIDRTARTVRTRSRRTYSYDTLVLATGSVASQVAVSGARLPGCFVLHSIEDAEAIRTFVEARSGVLGAPAARRRDRGRPTRARSGGRSGRGGGRNHDRAVCGSLAARPVG